MLLSPSPVAIVALVVDHFGNIWSWALFGGQLVSTRRPPTTWPKKSLVSRGVAVVLLVGTEDAGCEHEYVGQKVFKYEPIRIKQL